MTAILGHLTAEDLLEIVHTHFQRHNLPDGSVDAGLRPVVECGPPVDLQWTEGAWE